MKALLVIRSACDRPGFLGSKVVDLPFVPTVGMDLGIGVWAGAPELEMGVECRVNQVTYWLDSGELEIDLDGDVEVATYEACGFKESTDGVRVAVDDVPEGTPENVRILNPKKRWAKAPKET